MAINHPAILSRSNIYNIDPKEIIIIDGWNPRTDFSGHEEFVSYIMENGPVFDPILVKKENGDIILRAGERRLRATLSAIEKGCEILSIPAIFLDPKSSDTEIFLRTISENNGKPLNPIEEADAFRRLKSWGISVTQIAKRIGKSEMHIYRRLILIDASEELKSEVMAKNINLADAEEIIKSSNGNIDTQNTKLPDKIKPNNPKPDKIIFKWNKITAQLSTRKDMPGTAKDLFFEMLGNINSFQGQLEAEGYDPDTMKFEISKKKGPVVG